MFCKVLLATVLFSFSAFAQGILGGDVSLESQQQNNSWTREEQAPPELKPLYQFENLSGSVAMKNIFEAEQIFCYEVFPQDGEHKGYTLDGFPIRGFCGMLNQTVRDTLAASFFANPTAVNFEEAEQCEVQPKVILRFIRGVDYTDVLLSSPCHAFVIFYAGTISAYNFKPSAELVDALVKNLQTKHQEFVSPALLNQLMPVGIIQNENQRKMVYKTKEPVRKWEEKDTEKVKKQEAEVKKQNTGWNKLKTRLK